MNFSELIQEVYTLTNRPDLEAETKSAIKAATLKAHQSDFYSKDIFETGIEFTDANFKHSLDYISLIPNFRSLKYLRRVEDENDDEGTFFCVLTPEETVDAYGDARTDIAYVAGRVLEIRASVSFSKALLGCYVFPIVTEGGYSSWVAALYPYVIVYEAARVIFKAIGYDEQSSAFEALVGEQFSLLRMSALSDVGY